MANKELTITRIIDAPREEVYKAWTDAKRLGEWWGPKHFTATVTELDAVPGGAMKIDMHDPQGNTYPGGGTYKELDEPSRIVFVTTALDKDGGIGIETLDTVTLEDMNGKTKMTLHVEVTSNTLEFEQALSGMDMGWNQSLDKFADSFIV